MASRNAKRSLVEIAPADKLLGRGLHKDGEKDRDDARHVHANKREGKAALKHRDQHARAVEHKSQEQPQAKPRRSVSSCPPRDCTQDGPYALACAQVDEKHDPNANEAQVERHRVNRRGRGSRVFALRKPKHSQTALERKDIHHVLHALARGHSPVGKRRNGNRNSPAHGRPQNKQRKCQSIAANQAKHALGGRTFSCHHSLRFGDAPGENH